METKNCSHPSSSHAEHTVLSIGSFPFPAVRHKMQRCAVGNTAHLELNTNYSSETLGSPRFYVCAEI